MSRRVRKSTVSRCVECYSRIFFDKMPDLGRVVTCRECGTKLEVIYLDPIELDWYEEGAYADVNSEVYDDYGSYDDYNY